MLVTVTERAREIGLRLAVAARRRDILTQFIEALTLALLGGVPGALFGIAAASAIGLVARWPIVIDAGAVLLAVSFAALVGIFFGYHPVRKAAMQRPIDALRSHVRLPRPSSGGRTQPTVIGRPRRRASLGRSGAARGEVLSLLENLGGMHPR
jgi:hypothetical protein